MGIKLIDLLKEAEEEKKPADDKSTEKADPAAEKELKDILKLNYPAFVKELGDNVKDPKFRQAIKVAADKNPIGAPSPISPKVTALKPTQNEIDVDKSLKFPLTDAASAAGCLKGGTVAIAGKSIVTGGGGKFIIDGHHRWSQLYCINPEASIKAIDIDIADPMDGLKATQLGIAGDIGKINTASVEGSNLLKMNENQLKKYVQRTITPEVAAVFKKMIGDKLNATAGIKEMNQMEFATLKGLIANYIWKNVKLMQEKNQPVSGAPERGIMPQTDDAKNWPEEAPKVDAIKEITRLKKLAGIK